MINEISSFMTKLGIDNFINTLMLFVTMCSAILTYLTLREMTRQNKLQVLPCLILHDIEQITIPHKIKEESGEYISDLHLVAKFIEKKLAFKIENIGNGVAENIKITFAIGNNFQINHYIRDEEDKYSFLIHDGINTNKYFAEIRKGYYNIDFCQIMKEGEVKNLKHIGLLSFLSLSILTMCWHQKAELPKLNPIIEAELQYQDFIGNIYHRKYKAMVKIEEDYYGAENEMILSVKFKK